MITDVPLDARGNLNTMQDETTVDSAAEGKSTGLHREIDWKGAFWVASGVPPAVLFTIGGVAATVGKLSWLVWTLSIFLGFLQSMTYAEIAGLFPHKAGGTSVYGAIAWVPYSKLVAPLSVWCNWFAWSPVLAIGSGLAAGYILHGLFPSDSAIRTWHLTLLNLSELKDGLSLRLNSTFILGALILFAVKTIQDGGILRSAKTTKILAVSVLIPLLLVGVVPIVTGEMVRAHFFPIVPIAHDASGNVVNGSWNRAGWTLMVGGMFLAAWSTYSFETAVCYTAELKNPKTDTFKAIFYSGLLCVLFFTLVPFAFQGFLGVGRLVRAPVLDARGAVVKPALYSGMLAPGIYNGTGVAKVMVAMIHGGTLFGPLLETMLLLAIALNIMTAMAGSSRTLYQASKDGWLPKYLSKVNRHGAPTNAMLTDFAFNMFLLLMSNYMFVLGASNVGYLIFNFLNLNAGWLHRVDRPRQERPWRAPTWLIGIGCVLSFVNLVFMGMGADVYGHGTLQIGLVFAALIVPVFLFRHYVHDKGVFPDAAIRDLEFSSDEKLVKRAGIWPYATLLAGAVVVYVSHRIAVY